jgi:hypothetical protein
MKATVLDIFEATCFNYKRDEGEAQILWQFVTQILHKSLYLCVSPITDSKRSIFKENETVFCSTEVGFYDTSSETIVKWKHDVY